MSEIPDVPDDVIERLSKAYNAAYADGWGDCAATDWSCHRDALRGLVAHLRAKPEDAAAVLDGELWDDTVLDRLTLTVRWSLPGEADRG